MLSALLTGVNRAFPYSGGTSAVASLTKDPECEKIWGKRKGARRVILYLF